MKKILYKIIKIKKTILYLLQAMLIYPIFIGLRLLPLDIASGIGGLLGRSLGPLMPKHKLAIANLKYVFPEITEKELKKITTRMWDNLGRMIGEFPHARYFNNKYKNRIKIKGTEHFDSTATMDIGGIIVSAHYGNWEIATSIASDYSDKIKLNLLYRKPNNFFLNPLFNRRKKSSNSKLIAKDDGAARVLLTALRNKEYIGILADQKINTGLLMDFLGHKTQVSDSAALFALRFGCPIIPARIVRTKGTHFEATIYPPIITPKHHDMAKESKEITIQIKELIESWIHEHPEQWLWIHDRWNLRKDGKLK